MSRSRIDFYFADGVYDFFLPGPRIAELQRKTGVGIGALNARLLKGVMKVGEKVYMDSAQAEFHYEDIIETIRQGLIGGERGVVNGEEVKVTPAVAEQLLQAYVFGEPLANYWSLAASVLGACVQGYDPPKKEQPAPERAVPKPSRKSKAGSTTASS